MTKDTHTPVLEDDKPIEYNAVNKALDIIIHFIRTQDCLSESVALCSYAQTRLMKAVNDLPEEERGLND